MGIREILAAIELIGRHQRPLLHFVKDILHVDEFTFAEIHVHTGPHELLDQHRQIEAVRIETAEVASSINWANDLAICGKSGQSFTSSSVMP